MPNIFSYTEYRKYLQDAWAERKTRDPRFSHRFIVQRAGFNSSAFFSRLLVGDVNLTPTGALRLAEVFHLNTQETRYFELMVLMDQAKSYEERLYYADRLASWRRVPVAALAASKAEFCKDWRAVAILEALEILEHRDDDGRLGALLVPPATADEVRAILVLLEDLELAKRGNDGIWRKTEQFISADEVDTESVNRFRRDTMDLAREAIDRFDREDRSISTLTATLSKAGFERVRDRLRLLRREILELSRSDDQADRVAQINLQVFPLLLLRSEDGR